jgi:uncharacterized protein YdeI (YjbR/CyaY-like superfamily)
MTECTIFKKDFKKEHNIEQEYYIGGNDTSKFISSCVIIKFKDGDTITFNKGQFVLDRYMYIRMLTEKVSNHRLKVRNDKINRIIKGMD